MQRASGLVKAARVNEETSSFFDHKSSQLRESEIVADAETHFAVISVKDTDLVTWDEGLGLVVGDFTRNVDVEKMDFIVLCLQLTFRIDHKGSVAEFSLMFTRDSSDSVHFELLALLLDGLEGGRVRKIFSVFGHMVLHVW